MDAGRSPAVFRCRCDFASETAEFSVSLALKAPDGTIGATGGKRCHLGDPSRHRGRSRRGEQPFVLALEARGKGIEQAAPQGVETAIRGNSLTKY